MHTVRLALCDSEAEALENRLDQGSGAHARAGAGDVAPQLEGVVELDLVGAGGEVLEHLAALL